MAQSTFSVRMDEALKEEFDCLCRDFGMNASTAINIFARAVVRERRIPFEVSADPFYSESNLRYLESQFKAYKEGNLELAEHELIED